MWNSSENFLEHGSHNQKKTVACDGLASQMALGTPVQGKLGALAQTDRGVRPSDNEMASRKQDWHNGRSYEQLLGAIVAHI